METNQGTNNPNEPVKAKDYIRLKQAGYTDDEIQGAMGDGYTVMVDENSKPVNMPDEQWLPLYEQSKMAVNAINQKALFNNQRTNYWDMKNKQTGMDVFVQDLYSTNASPFYTSPYHDSQPIMSKDNQATYSGKYYTRDEHNNLIGHDMTWADRHIKPIFGDKLVRRQDKDGNYFVEKVDSHDFLVGDKMLSVWGNQDMYTQKWWEIPVQMIWNGAGVGFTGSIHTLSLMSSLLVRKGITGIFGEELGQGSENSRLINNAPLSLENYMINFWDNVKYQPSEKTEEQGFFGSGFSFASYGAEMFGEMIPQIIMAAFTGGGSAAARIGSKVTSKAAINTIRNNMIKAQAKAAGKVVANESPTVLGKVANWTTGFIYKEMLKSPSMLAATIPATDGVFRSAIANGLNQDEAAMVGAMSFPMVYLTESLIGAKFVEGVIGRKFGEKVLSSAAKEFGKKATVELSQEVYKKTFNDIVGQVGVEGVQTALKSNKGTASIMKRFGKSLINNALADVAKGGLKEGSQESLEEVGYGLVEVLWDKYLSDVESTPGDGQYGTDLFSSAFFGRVRESFLAAGIMGGTFTAVGKTKQQIDKWSINKNPNEKATKIDKAARKTIDYAVYNDEWNDLIEMSKQGREKRMSQDANEPITPIKIENNAFSTWGFNEGDELKTKGDLRAYTFAQEAEARKAAISQFGLNSPELTSKYIGKSNIAEASLLAERVADYNQDNIDMTAIINDASSDQQMISDAKAKIQSNNLQIKKASESIKYLVEPYKSIDKDGKEKIHSYSVAYYDSIVNHSMAIMNGKDNLNNNERKLLFDEMNVTSENIKSVNDWAANRVDAIEQMNIISSDIKSLVDKSKKGGVDIDQVSKEINSRIGELATILNTTGVSLTNTSEDFDSLIDYVNIMQNNYRSEINAIEEEYQLEPTRKEINIDEIFDEESYPQARERALKLEQKYKDINSLPKQIINANLRTKNKLELQELTETNGDPTAIKDLKEAIDNEKNRNKTFDYEGVLNDFNNFNKRKQELIKIIDTSENDAEINKATEEYKVLSANFGKSMTALTNKLSQLMHERDIMNVLPESNEATLIGIMDTFLSKGGGNSILANIAKLKNDNSVTSKDVIKMQIDGIQSEINRVRNLLSSYKAFSAIKKSGLDVPAEIAKLSFEMDDSIVSGIVEIQDWLETTLKSVGSDKMDKVITRKDREFNRQKSIVKNAIDIIEVMFDRLDDKYDFATWLSHKNDTLSREFYNLSISEENISALDINKPEDVSRLNNIYNTIVNVQDAFKYFVDENKDAATKLQSVIHEQCILFWTDHHLDTGNSIDETYFKGDIYNGKDNIIGSTLKVLQTNSDLKINNINDIPMSLDFLKLKKCFKYLEELEKAGSSKLGNSPAGIHKAALICYIDKYLQGMVHAMGTMSTLDFYSSLKENTLVDNNTGEREYLTQNQEVSLRIALSTIDKSLHYMQEKATFLKEDGAGLRRETRPQDNTSYNAIRGVYIPGRAGTGKSYITRFLIRNLIKKLNGKGRILILAPSKEFANAIKVNAVGVNPDKNMQFDTMTFDEYVKISEKSNIKYDYIIADEITRNNESKYRAIINSQKINPNLRSFFLGDFFQYAQNMPDVSSTSMAKYPFIQEYVPSLPALDEVIRYEIADIQLFNDSIYESFGKINIIRPPMTKFNSTKTSGVQQMVNVTDVINEWEKDVSNDGEHSNRWLVFGRKSDALAYLSSNKDANASLVKYIIKNVDTNGPQGFIDNTVQGYENEYIYNAIMPDLDFWNQTIYYTGISRSKRFLCVPIGVNINNSVQDDSIVDYTVDGVAKEANATQNKELSKMFHNRLNAIKSIEAENNPKKATPVKTMPVKNTKKTKEDSVEKEEVVIVPEEETIIPPVDETESATISDHVDDAKTVHKTSAIRYNNNKELTLGNAIFVADNNLSGKTFDEIFYSEDYQKTHKKRISAISRLSVKNEVIVHTISGDKLMMIDNGIYKIGDANKQTKVLVNKKYLNDPKPEYIYGIFYEPSSDVETEDKGLNTILSEYNAKLQSIQDGMPVMFEDMVIGPPVVKMMLKEEQTSPRSFTSLYNEISNKGYLIMTNSGKFEPATASNKENVLFKRTKESGNISQYITIKDSISKQTIDLEIKNKRLTEKEFDSAVKELEAMKNPTLEEIEKSEAFQIILQNKSVIDSNEIDFDNVIVKNERGYYDIYSKKVNPKKTVLEGLKKLKSLASDGKLYAPFKFETRKSTGTVESDKFLTRIKSINASNLYAKEIVISNNNKKSDDDLFNMVKASNEAPTSVDKSLEETKITDDLNSEFIKKGHSKPNTQNKEASVETVVPESIVDIKENKIIEDAIDNNLSKKEKKILLSSLTVEQVKQEIIKKIIDPSSAFINNISDNVKQIIIKLSKIIITTYLVIGSYTTLNNNTIPIRDIKTNNIVRVDASLSQSANNLYNYGLSKKTAFIVVDKENASVNIYDEKGVKVAEFPALLGAQAGDTINTSELDDPTKAGATTPSGEYRMATIDSLNSEYNGRWITISRVGEAETTSGQLGLHETTHLDYENRIKALETETPEDNKISYGCINISPENFDKYIKPYFSNGGIMLISPDAEQNKVKYEFTTDTNRAESYLIDKLGSDFLRDNFAFTDNIALEAWSFDTMADMLDTGTIVKTSQGYVYLGKQFNKLEDVRRYLMYEKQLNEPLEIDKTKFGLVNGLTMRIAKGDNGYLSNAEKHEIVHIAVNLLTPREKILLFSAAKKQIIADKKISEDVIDDTYIEEYLAGLNYGSETIVTPIEETNILKRFLNWLMKVLAFGRMQYSVGEFLTDIDKGKFKKRYKSTINKRNKNMFMDLPEELLKQYGFSDEKKTVEVDSAIKIVGSAEKLKMLANTIGKKLFNDSIYSTYNSSGNTDDLSESFLTVRGKIESIVSRKVEELSPYLESIGFNLFTENNGSFTYDQSYTIKTAIPGMNLEDSRSIVSSIQTFHKFLNSKEVSDAVYSLLDFEKSFSESEAHLNRQVFESSESVDSLYFISPKLKSVLSFMPFYTYEKTENGLLKKSNPQYTVSYNPISINYNILDRKLHHIMEGSKHVPIADYAVYMKHKLRGIIAGYPKGEITSAGNSIISFYEYMFGNVADFDGTVDPNVVPIFDYINDYENMVTNPIRYMKLNNLVNSMVSYFASMKKENRTIAKVDEKGNYTFSNVFVNNVTETKERFIKYLRGLYNGGIIKPEIKERLTGRYSNIAMNYNANSDELIIGEGRFLNKETEHKKYPLTGVSLLSYDGRNWKFKNDISANQIQRLFKNIGFYISINTIKEVVNHLKVTNEVGKNKFATKDSMNNMANLIGYMYMTIANHYNGKFTSLLEEKIRASRKPKDKSIITLVEDYKDKKNALQEFVDESTVETEEVNKAIEDIEEYNKLINKIENEPNLMMFFDDVKMLAEIDYFLKDTSDRAYTTGISQKQKHAVISMSDGVSDILSGGKTGMQQYVEKQTEDVDTSNNHLFIDGKFIHPFMIKEVTDFGYSMFSGNVAEYKTKDQRKFFTMEIIDSAVSMMLQDMNNNFGLRPMSGFASTTLYEPFGEKNGTMINSMYTNEPLIYFANNNGNKGKVELNNDLLNKMIGTIFDTKMQLSKNTLKKFTSFEMMIDGKVINPFYLSGEMKSKVAKNGLDDIYKKAIKTGNFKEILSIMDDIEDSINIFAKNKGLAPEEMIKFMQSLQIGEGVNAEGFSNFSDIALDNEGKLVLGSAAQNDMIDATSNILYLQEWYKSADKTIARQKILGSRLYELHDLLNKDRYYLPKEFRFEQDYLKKTNKLEDGNYTTEWNTALEGLVTLHYISNMGVSMISSGTSEFFDGFTDKSSRNSQTGKPNGLLLVHSTPTTLPRYIRTINVPDKVVFNDLAKALTGVDASSKVYDGDMIVHELVKMMMISGGGDGTISNKYSSGKIVVGGIDMRNGRPVNNKCSAMFMDHFFLNKTVNGEDINMQMIETLGNINDGDESYLSRYKSLMNEYGNNHKKVYSELMNTIILQRMSGFSDPMKNFAGVIRTSEVIKTERSQMNYYVKSEEDGRIVYNTVDFSNVGPDLPLTNLNSSYLDVSLIRLQQDPISDSDESGYGLQVNDHAFHIDSEMGTKVYKNLSAMIRQKHKSHKKEVVKKGLKETLKAKAIKSTEKYGGPFGIEKSILVNNKITDSHPTVSRLLTSALLSTMNAIKSPKVKARKLVQQPGYDVQRFIVNDSLTGQKIKVSRDELNKYADSSRYKIDDVKNGLDHYNVLDKDGNSLNDEIISSWKTSEDNNAIDDIVTRAAYVDFPEVIVPARIFDFFADVENRPSTMSKLPDYYTLNDLFTITIGGVDYCLTPFFDTYGLNAGAAITQIKTNLGNSNFPDDVEDYLTTLNTFRHAFSIRTPGTQASSFFSSKIVDIAHEDGVMYIPALKNTLDNSDQDIDTLGMFLYDYSNRSALGNDRIALFIDAYTDPKNLKKIMTPVTINKEYADAIKYDRKYNVKFSSSLAGTALAKNEINQGKTNVANFVNMLSAVLRTLPYKTDNPNVNTISQEDIDTLIREIGSIAQMAVDNAKKQGFGAIGMSDILSSSFISLLHTKSSADIMTMIKKPAIQRLVKKVEKSTMVDEARTSLAVEISNSIDAISQYLKEDDLAKLIENEKLILDEKIAYYEEIVSKPVGELVEYYQSKGVTFNSITEESEIDEEEKVVNNRADKKRKALNKYIDSLKQKRSKFDEEMKIKEEYLHTLVADMQDIYNAIPYGDALLRFANVLSIKADMEPTPYEMFNYIGKLEQAFDDNVDNIINGVVGPSLREMTVEKYNKVSTNEANNYTGRKQTDLDNDIKIHLGSLLDGIKADIGVTGQSGFGSSIVKELSKKHNVSIHLNTAYSRKNSLGRIENGNMAMVSLAKDTGIGVDKLRSMVKLNEGRFIKSVEAGMENADLVINLYTKEASYERHWPYKIKNPVPKMDLFVHDGRMKEGFNSQATQKKLEDIRKKLQEIMKDKPEGYSPKIFINTEFYSTTSKVKKSAEEIEKDIFDKGRSFNIRSTIDKLPDVRSQLDVALSFYTDMKAINYRFNSAMLRTYKNILKKVGNYNFVSGKQFNSIVDAVDMSMIGYVFKESAKNPASFNHFDISSHTVSPDAYNMLSNFTIDDNYKADLFLFAVPEYLRGIKESDMFAGNKVIDNIDIVDNMVVFINKDYDARELSLYKDDMARIKSENKNLYDVLMAYTLLKYGFNYFPGSLRDFFADDFGIEYMEYMDEFVEFVKTNESFRNTLEDNVISKDYGVKQNIVRGKGKTTDEDKHYIGQQFYRLRTDVGFKSLKSLVKQVEENGKYEKHRISSLESNYSQMMSHDKNIMWDEGVLVMDPATKRYNFSTLRPVIHPKTLKEAVDALTKDNIQISFKSPHSYRQYQKAIVFGEEMLITHSENSEDGYFIKLKRLGVSVGSVPTQSSLIGPIMNNFVEMLNTRMGARIAISDKINNVVSIVNSQVKLSPLRVSAKTNLMSLSNLFVENFDMQAMNDFIDENIGASDRFFGNVSRETVLARLLRYDNVDMLTKIFNDVSTANQAMQVIQGTWDGIVSDIVDISIGQLANNFRKKVKDTFYSGKLPVLTLIKKLVDYGKANDNIIPELGSIDTENLIAYKNVASITTMKKETFPNIFAHEGSYAGVVFKSEMMNGIYPGRQIKIGDNDSYLTIQVIGFNEDKSFNFRVLQDLNDNPLKKIVTITTDSYIVNETENFTRTGNIIREKTDSVDNDHTLIGKAIASKFEGILTNKYISTPGVEIDRFVSVITDGLENVRQQIAKDFFVDKDAITFKAEIVALSDYIDIYNNSYAENKRAGGTIDILAIINEGEDNEMVIIIDVKNSRLEYALRSSETKELYDRQISVYEDIIGGNNGFTTKKNVVARAILPTTTTFSGAFEKGKQTLTVESMEIEKLQYINKIC